MLYPKPFLKWVGGKSQIIDEVLAKFPDKINNYYEPFLGGGSVLLAFLTLAKNKKITLQGLVYASDKNRYLIQVYKNIQHNPSEVIHYLKKLCKPYWLLNRNSSNIHEASANKETYYYWVRNMYNKMTDDEKLSCHGSACFIFLNKTGFRGLYRESSKGFNVSYGNYKNPSIFDEDHINKISVLIRDVVFTDVSFERVLNKTTGKKDDFFYLDPPYVQETKTSFTNYTYDGFDNDFNTKLFEMCHSLQKLNISFVMSNSNTMIVKRAFPKNKYKVQVIECNRTINSKNPDSKSKELLVSYNSK